MIEGALLTETLGAAILLVGGAIVGFAGLGLIRLSDPFMRMHAATKAGVVGAGLVMLGVGVASGTTLGVFTGVAGLLFLCATAPIASHVLGRAAYIAGAPISPTTIRDALSGVLPRNVFDIDPARTINRRKRGAGPTQEESMSAVQQLRTDSFLSPTPSADARAIKRLTAWLIGGDNQNEALAVAFELAGASGAAVTGLTAFEVEPTLKRQAMPAGGAYWAAWLAGRKRQRMRERASEALTEFNAFADERSVPADARHVEGNLYDVTVAASGADIIVVPAGVDAEGEPARLREEIAAKIGAGQAAPVLRVTRRPSGIRRVGILVDRDPTSRRLAHGLVGSGLAAGAEVTIMPIGVDDDVVHAQCQELAELLEAHGQKVEISRPLDLLADQHFIVERLRPMDMVAMTKLTGRTGWLSQAREDAHETAATSAPLTLLV